MKTRSPASQRTQDLSALIEGRLRTASAKDELVKLATRLIVEKMLEGEAACGRGPCDCASDWPVIILVSCYCAIEHRDLAVLPLV
jgi:hypothetical protein